jgi:lambda family phage portal protein
MSDLEKQVRDAALEIFGKNLATEAQAGQAAKTRTSAPRAVVFRNGYNAAKVDRLSADMRTFSLSADGELRYALRTIRARARDLAMNNDHARKYLKMVVRHTVGPTGITFRPNIFTIQPGGKKVLDKPANAAIAALWEEWGRKGSCTVCGRYSWTEVQQVVAESKSRDGEIFIRMVRGWNGNRFRFALQLLEADYCDEDINRKLPNGNTIRMGVELDQYFRPVAYWFRNSHPGDSSSWQVSQSRHVRVPAEDVLHIYDADRAGMTRGVTDFHTVMRRLHMIGEYESSALINARVGAAKMAFLQQTQPGAPPMEGDDEEEDTGDLIEEVEAGTVEWLPPGWELKPFDPKYPDAEFGPFRKELLKSIASGLDISYVSLASDLEGVNLSSIRYGVMDERDTWRTEQNHLIEQLNRPVHENLLETALLAGEVGYYAESGAFIALPYAKLDKFKAARWRGRGWNYMDPLKDANANTAEVKNGTNSRTRICAARGEDFEEILDDLAVEEQMASERGLNITEDPAAAEGRNALAAQPNE